MDTQTKGRKLLSFSDIISILAILFSLITFVYSARRDKSVDLQAKRKEIQDNLHTIIQLETNSKEKADSVRTTIQNYLANNWYIKIQMEVLLDNIDNVNLEIPRKLSSAQYNHIAYCYENYAFSAIKAIEYYNLALSTASDIYDSINCLESLTNFYYTAPFFKNIVQAHSYIRMDIDALKHQDKKIANYYMVDQFGKFAIKEVYYNKEEAKKFLDSSKYYCKELLPDKDLYNFGVDLVNYNAKYLRYFEMNCDTLTKI